MANVSTDVRFVHGYLAQIAGRTASGADLRGVYVTGSIALGDFRPATSDVDVLVVVTGTPSRERLRNLANTIAAIPIPVRGLEYVMYPLAAVAKPDRHPRWVLNLNLGPRLAAPHVGFEPDAEPGYWVILDLALARQAGIPLLGPPAREVIGEIPRAWIADALLDELAWLRDNEPATPNRVLNLCRAWRWTDDATLVSKSAAAAWAHERTGDSVVDAAARIRATGEGSLDEADVEALIARLEPLIERALA